ncbi:hypothetical protein BGZ61DRAFT_478928 [Ilyonectria robusta]|uniref:uncharacterized protein n=1 Tax=Ilyonectria robusta TaxID=1079257 RepID=UPI001E8D0E7C|nr:uncharacterized protein BGZ61DRAFT_478928 [Ilyonectria robusta]KAH8686684.1 hypothetical protein BGZ61DRAFT_478928 [Ilyonectria robusta]
MASVHFLELTPMDPPTSASLRLSTIASSRLSANMIRRANSCAYPLARLSQNLLRGGIDEGTIAILSNEEPSAEERQAAAQEYGIASLPNGQGNQSSKAPSSSSPRHASRGDSSSSRGHRNGGNWDEVDSFSENASMSIDSSIGGAPVAGSTVFSTTPPNPQIDRQATRTIHLCNLAEGVTHADITAAIRGGQLLDVYIKHRDRLASVSFVHGEDAKAFYARARHYDLYIKNKRVELKWADRQYTLPGHVAHKIDRGASRNLVIRNCDPNHTEETIREDLEHIHNLVVIQVDFIKADCFIRTSSIHNAMFARTCMLSRAKYRGSRIQWAADECAQPLAQAPIPRRSSAPSVKTPPTNRMANRFQLLELGGDERFGGDDDADDDDSDDTLH